MYKVDEPEVNIAKINKKNKSLEGDDDPTSPKEVSSFSSNSAEQQANLPPSPDTSSATVNAGSSDSAAETPDNTEDSEGDTPTPTKANGKVHA